MDHAARAPAPVGRPASVCADRVPPPRVSRERAGIAGLAEGQQVSYELETGRDGKQSETNLRML